MYFSFLLYISYLFYYNFREPVELAFPSMKVTVKLPKIIDGSCVCVRAARSMIDLLSESSRSYALNADMPNRYEGRTLFQIRLDLIVLVKYICLVKMYTYIFLNLHALSLTQ